MKMYSKSKKSPFLAQVPFYWCDKCHTPVMGKLCSCGNKTRPVFVTPPGDVRPAFEHDRNLINSLFEYEFGVKLIPDGYPALLNKVPGGDRMDEIVVGGAVVCAVRYIPFEDRWEVLPREAASVIVNPKKRVIRVSDEAAEFIKGGSSVLMPGVTYVSPDIKIGDSVFVISESGECAAVGRAKMSYDEAKSAKRGQIVKTRRTQKQTVDFNPSTWDDAIAANSDIIDLYERKSIEFVKDVISKNPELTPTISYSGGKDSLATLLVTLKAGLRLPMIFADTGLEFEETLNNVKHVSELYGLECFSSSGSERFWKDFEINGPPAVDYRWCCKACKLIPIKELIEKNWGEVLSFIGQRKFESAKRLQSPRVWRNRNVPCQLSAAPIQHWSAMHVWLYLFRENAPYNPLYELGLDRIGCFICPSSDLACMKDIALKYPKRWEQWIEKLQEWGCAHGKPNDWASSGLWRVKEKYSDDGDTDEHF